MKKRIALAAAIALAISVGGMLPAFATKPAAPVVTTNTCVRTTAALEISSVADLTVSVVGGALQVAGSAAGSIGDGSGSPAQATCAAGYGSFTGLTSVLLKTMGKVTFLLEDGTTNDAIANYRNVAFTVRSDDDLVFDGTGLDNVFFSVNGTVTEESFIFGTLTGSYYQSGLFKFLGSDAADSVDASAVTTSDVWFEGNAGADTLKGGEGADAFVGGSGNDVIYGNAGNDTLDTKTGDTVTPGDCPKFSLNNPQKPGACKSLNPAVSGADEAWGGVGNDTFTADAGDTVAPGDGIDGFVSTTSVYQLNYTDSSAAITLNLTTAAGIVKSAGGDDYYGAVSVATFVGSNLADTMVGDGSANYFYGNDGADTLLGFGDADLLSGNGGTDAIKGGLGNDSLYGDTGADKINGGDGDDVVYMGGGDDIAYGSAGDDVLRGQKGSDQAWGGKGTFDVCAAEVTDSCEFKK